MDEKKNIPFIPGLALILAVLALALIAVNSMNSTPSMEAMEQAMDAKITAVENAIVAQVKSGEMIGNNVNFSLLNHDLNNLIYSLDRVNVEPGTELGNDVVALKDAALKLQAKLAPKAKTE